MRVINNMRRSFAIIVLLALCTCFGSVAYAYARLDLAYDVVPPKYCLCFDLDLDGQFDIYDLLLFAKSFGATEGTSNWVPLADANFDGIIDIFDAIHLARLLNSQS